MVAFDSTIVFGVVLLLLLLLLLLFLLLLLVLLLVLRVPLQYVCNNLPRGQSTC